MFCSGVIRFDHFTSCPFYIAFCQIMDGYYCTNGTAHNTMKAESDKCRKRCDKNKDRAPADVDDDPSKFTERKGYGGFDNDE
ncbi:MAG: hypothetical protein FWF07_01280 [Methanomassiliicoccaceae archaeon]|nr:hypothetical protein [Methanomassiliicoccaceae archaeon]